MSAATANVNGMRADAPSTKAPVINESFEELCMGLAILAVVSNGRFIKLAVGGEITAQVGPIFAIMATAVQDAAAQACPAERS
jgi:hypothetical protein